MIPTERMMEEAIDRLDNASFQRLAESYATVMFPRRFQGLSVLGRNLRGQTVTGWPDAFVVRHDGTLDAVEASRDQRNWGDHLDKDLKNAAELPPPGLGGLIYVSWARTPQPRFLKDRRDQLVRLAGDSARINLVFRQQLVRELLHPRFARVWLEILGLRVPATPWQSIEEAPIYGGDSVTLFVPTRDEHELGLVRQPHVDRQVERALESRRFAYVVGVGASGKTTLAADVGLRLAGGGAPVYYVDMAALGEDSGSADARALEVLIERSDDNVLFVVDNVHHDASASLRLLKQVLETPNSGQMLMLGRRIHDIGQLRGLPWALAPLEDSAIELRVETSTLRAAAVRLLRRAGREVDPPLPAELRGWLRLFGGDLIAFSAAFVQRLERDGTGRDLVAHDARDYVADRYLHGLSDEERADLLLVADLSALEYGVSAELVSVSRLRRALAGGLVELSDLGYRTVHPGLGELLLAAANADVGDFAPDRLAAAGYSELSSSARVIDRLRKAGRLEAADRLTRALAYDTDIAIAFLLARGARHLIAQRQLLEQVFGAAGVDELLTADAEPFERLIQTGTLPDLLMLGRASRRALPRTRQLLAKLASPDTLDPEGLADSLQYLPAKALPLELRQLGRFLPLLYEPVLAALASTGALREFVRSAPKLSPSRWMDLVDATRASEQFSRALAREIEDNPAGVTRMLLRIRRLGRVFGALDGPLQVALRRHLESDDFREAAAEGALTSGPNRLISLLEIAAMLNQALLRDLDGLADQPQVVAEAVNRWKGAPKAGRRLIALADEVAPRLARALDEAFEWGQPTSGEAP